MLGKLEDISFITEGCNSVLFFGGQMVILSVDLYKTNLNDVNLMKMILKVLLMSDFWLGVIDLESKKHLKKI